MGRAAGAERPGATLADVTTQADQGLPDDELARRRSGLLLGASAYFMWGFMPLVFAAAAPSSSLEALAHRIVWSLLCCVLLLMVLGRERPFGGLRRVLAIIRTPKDFWLLAAATLFVGANWFVFLLGVETGRVVEVSLGYYINPLLTVLLGVVFLGERLRRLQWAALAIGLIAVVVSSFGYGGVPWFGLAVAVTFGTYGMLKNRLGGRIGAVEGMTVETLVLTPFCIAYIAWLTMTGASTFANHGWWHAGVLMFLGPMTAIPLICFGAAAAKIPLSWLGMLQYIAPTMQFLVGLLIFGEQMSAARWAGFAIIWVATAILIADMLQSSRRSRRARRAQSSPRR